MDDTRHLIERARRNAEEARRVSEQNKLLRKTSQELQQWTARVKAQISTEAKALLAFDSGSNLLLRLLPPTELERLTSLLQSVRLPAKQVLHRANTAIEHVYFPASGLLSAIVLMQDGEGIEVATIGNEGMVGLNAFVGSGISPYDVVVQIPGRAWRIDVPKFQAELKREGMLRELLTSYQSVLSVQTVYQIACNGLHSVNKRCCRRLLSTQDRVGGNALPLTHSILAQSLGVRRATVTEELSSLRSFGAIDSSRGQITVLNRAKLQSRACECYQVMNNEYALLFRPNRQ